MGYRSDVAALIYPADDTDVSVQQAAYDQLKLLMGTTFKNVFDEFSECLIWVDEHRALKFGTTDVKWYSSYKDVAMFEDMLRAFGGEVEGYCTEFVRVGEETEDIEQKFSGDTCEYYLNVRRSIDCNV